MHLIKVGDTIFRVFYFFWRGHSCWLWPLVVVAGSSGTVHDGPIGLFVRFVLFMLLSTSSRHPPHRKKIQSMYKVAETTTQGFLNCAAPLWYYYSRRDVDADR